jgi:hypothetical protein
MLAFFAGALIALEQLPLAIGVTRPMLGEKRKRRQRWKLR